MERTPKRLRHRGSPLDAVQHDPCRRSTILRDDAAHAATHHCVLAISARNPNPARCTKKASFGSKVNGRTQCDECSVMSSCNSPNLRSS
ncbi:hypothetical protein HNY73_002214 [Argiope bruennichi]|uniref:Uncharacterized protein n=1 Tax=Argiope bruennichi TaxID=94029 RepID=A0A8T0FZA5_ARGBR|nr:hypothetical protein HNY73_002214 [Argiope bruennichi]